MNFKLNRLLLIVGLSALCTFSHAENQALLIGIGEYQLRGANLPGIDKDLGTMQAVAGMMGYKPSQIHTLANRQATLAGIRIAFQRHLIRGTKPDDRVLLYFSGHGTQLTDRSGDEADGVDEAFLPYDARKRYRRGEIRLEKVLLDDEIGALLAAIPAKEVLVVIDSCHSGTLTRFLNFGETSQYFPKTYWHSDLPIANRSPVEVADQSDSELTYVGISAARDGQLAVATEEGSVFTQLLMNSVQKAYSHKHSLPLLKLKYEISSSIAEHVPAEQLFEPVLNGSTEAARVTFVLRSRAPENSSSSGEKI